MTFQFDNMKILLNREPSWFGPEKKSSRSQISSKKWVDNVVYTASFIDISSIWTQSSVVDSSNYEYIISF